MSLLPTTAMALFFDEIRLEANNKQSFMGHYGGHLYLLDPQQQPLDRLAVFITAKWDLDAVPETATVVMTISDQESMEFQVSIGSKPTHMTPRSPFAGMIIRLPLNMRLVPLKPDDKIEVWIVVGEERMPAGRLLVHAQQSPASTP